MKKILITGSEGQIGSELTLKLREKYGDGNVVACDRKTKLNAKHLESGPFEWLDVADAAKLADVCRKYDIDTIINMAAILSATGEKNPMSCWNVNINGLINCLEVARDMEMTRVICPSSMAVFGAGCPLQNTPQETVLKPVTMYGVTKVAGELLCDYYVRRFNVDVRGLRYPGIISSETLPGGGTTDYAVEIYYKAIEQGSYDCFVREDTKLPMMYMPDCLKATIDLMEAPFDALKHHGDFNVGSMSFSVAELAAEIRKHIPEFTVTYSPDYRQAIADSWPESIDDQAAREEWEWNPSYSIESMTIDMLKKLKKRHDEGNLYR
ncbi:MAG: NAD-dependent epimerase/dehydratase family protein [Planctomycetota bacterium]